jgi:hypothetical protein
LIVLSSVSFLYIHILISLPSQQLANLPSLMIAISLINSLCAFA